MQLVPSSDARELLVSALGSLSAHSRRTYLSSLNNIAEMLGFAGATETPWHKMQPSHVAAMRAILKAKYEPSTINVHLAAFVCIVNAVWRQTLISSEQRDKLLDFKREKGSRELAGRMLTNKEISALFSACASDQERAILAVLYSCGLRRSEVAALKISDLSNNQLRVIGKGNKERKVFLNQRANEYVSHWIAERGFEPGPLFRKKDFSPYSDKAIYRLCKRLQKASGVAAFTPHDLRRSMVSYLLDAGVDLPTVQGIAGHASPQMTARYDRRNDEVRQKASELLFVP